MSVLPHGYRFPGVPLALAAAMLFGATAPFSKILLGDVDPQLLAGLLYLGAGIGLAILHVLRARIGVQAHEARLTRADLPWLAVVILTGGGLGPLFLMLGLARMPASGASLLLNLEGLATMAIAWLVFRENVDRRLLLGALAIVAGAVLLTWRGHAMCLGAGAGFIAAACLAWGIDNNLTRKLAAVDPVVTTAIKGLVAGTVNATLALLRGARLPDAGTLATSGLVGFFGVGVSLVLFVMALRHLGTARTGAYFSLAPFIGALLSVLLLHEAFTINLALAGALMASGLWVHLAERHAHEHRHAALDHDHSHVHDEHHRHGHDGAAVPHAHRHTHRPMIHAHAHYPDLHHRHDH